MPEVCISREEDRHFLSANSWLRYNVSFGAVCIRIIMPGILRIKGKGNMMSGINPNPGQRDPHILASYQKLNLGC